MIYILPLLLNMWILSEFCNSNNSRSFKRENASTFIASLRNGGSWSSTMRVAGIVDSCYCAPGEKYELRVLPLAATRLTPLLIQSFRVTFPATNNRIYRVCSVLAHRPASPPVQLGQYCSILIVDTPSELTVNWILSNIGDKENDIIIEPNIRDTCARRSCNSICAGNAPYSTSRNNWSVQQETDRRLTFPASLGEF